MILASDGYFYGTTYGGGASGVGTVFRIDPGGNLTTVHSFAYADGANPLSGLMQASDGKLYGTTTRGGANNLGTLFKMDLAGNVTRLHSFDGTDGKIPRATLLEASDGNFYGTTSAGGASYDSGTVFRMSPAGVFTTLHNFNRYSDSSTPAAELIEASDGFLYGTTFGELPPTGGGTVFRVDSAGVVTIVHTFTGADGQNPLAPLIQASDGNLYGTAYAGGAYGAGLVYQLAASVFTPIHHFNKTDGNLPSGGLVQGPDGYLYGTTVGINQFNDYGSAFRVTTSGQLVGLHTFSSSGGNPRSALVFGSDGALYGTTNATRLGYPDPDGRVPGAVFRLETTGEFESLHTFGWEDGAVPSLTQAADGDFYGTTAAGGTSNLGTIFRLRSNGDYEILQNFSGANGSTPTALIQATDGNFYGSTYGGGAQDIGTIFRLTAQGDLTILHEFQDIGTNREGARPSALIQSGNDELSGAAMYGGCCTGADTGGGTLFHVDFSGNLQVFASFDPFTQSYHPNGPLVSGFRGTNRDGGAGGYGGTFAGELRGHDFDPENGDGAVPLAGLTDIDGTVLGTTSSGGANGNGTIFEWEGGFDDYTWHDFTADEGRGTEAPLVFINTPNFSGIFGTTDSTIFRLDWDHSVHVLHTFSGIGGTYPTAAMVQGLDGNIYGAANAGPFGAGAIFRLSNAQIAVNEVSPRSGFGGAALTVVGGAFTPGVTVTIGGVDASDVTVLDPTFLYLFTPTLSPGTYDVTVTAPGGSSATLVDAYVVKAAGPTIISFTPPAGPVGANVTINGTGFSGVSSVKFNGKAAAFHVLSSTQLTASVSGGTTSGKITVTTAAGTATSATDFIVAVPPTVTGFSPGSGIPGTPVVVTGTNFDTASAVAFNGFGATFTINSPTQITATVPSTATTGKIKVTNAAGGAYSVASFLVLPTITSFTPASGLAGTSVTINGTTFNNASAVQFNGLAAAFTLNSSSKITAKAPSGVTTGKITVSTPGGTAASPTSFMVLPAITSFTPAAGPINTKVTVNGTGFTGVSSVKFNGKLASFIIVLSPTQLTANVSSGSTSGKITVTTTAGTATSATNFVVVVPPTVTGFTPAGGMPGTSVVITGTGFDTASAVAFNGFGATFTINSPTQIIATVPPLATTGKIKVTNAAGGAYSVASFLVPPQITSFTPASGRVGINVTINGKTFNNVSSVKFNGIAATFTVNSPTKITATVPSGATTGKIAVTTPGGTVASAADFTVSP